MCSILQISWTCSQQNPLKREHSFAFPLLGNDIFLHQFCNQEEQQTLHSVTDCLFSQSTCRRGASYALSTGLHLALTKMIRSRQVDSTSLRARIDRGELPYGSPLCRPVTKKSVWDQNRPGGPIMADDNWPEVVRALTCERKWARMLDETFEIRRSVE